MIPLFDIQDVQNYLNISDDQIRQAEELLDTECRDDLLDILSKIRCIAIEKKDQPIADAFTFFLNNYFRDVDEIKKSGFCLNQKHDVKECKDES